MSERQRADTVLTVVGTENLGPRIIRVRFGGSGVDDYLAADIGSTDKYVKLLFDTPEKTSRRTYTVRGVDAECSQLWIDFVVHGDVGLAGPWALAAQPGDRLHINGPGGAYEPPGDADHHLFVGDEAALPAICASLERLGAGARATAFIEIDGPDDELVIVTDADLDLRWLHREPAAPGTTDLLFDAVRAWDWPAGRVSAFVHGESALLKTLRPWLLDGRVEREDISVSAYWRKGADEDGFRAWKKQQKDAVMRPAQA